MQRITYILTRGAGMLKQAKQESQEEIEQYRQRFQSLEGAHQLQITNLEEQLDHLRKQAGEIDENLCKMTDARNSFIEKLSGKSI